jgi:hypothetical protein
MAELNLDWGKCIKDLLDRHGLSLRAARIKSQVTVSHMTIKDWADGVVPVDYRKAWEFLYAFPAEEAMECLRVARLPMPPEWEAEEYEKNLRQELAGRDDIEEVISKALNALNRVRRRRVERQQ